MPIILHNMYTDMTQNSGKEKFDRALQAGVIKKLLKADLFTAAEIFGHTPDDKERRLIDEGTCTEDEFIQRALKIAEVSGDKMLAENALQRMTYSELKYPLTPATLSTLDVFAEKFYAFWEDGKMISVRSELADFPQWYNAAQIKAEKIYTASEMEKILIMACNKDRDQKAALLWKLVCNFIDSEIIRVGYLYPDRDMAQKVLVEFMDKLRELLLIREQHRDASLQSGVGYDPEELIPYVTSNIVKNLLNDNLNDALDNVNALSYLHYAAQETEANIAGTDAYAVLEKEFALFKDGAQCSWPNEIRKMFSDAKMVEILVRYRFTHGLIAVNTALAFRHAESKTKLELATREEDAIILNGLLLTQTGYIKSSGFQDTAIREQFIRDINFFRKIRSEVEHHKTRNFFQLRDELDVKRALLEEKLKSGTSHVDQWIIAQRQINEDIEEEITRLESALSNSGDSFFKKFVPFGESKANLDQKEQLQNELKENQAMLKDMLEISDMHKEIKRFFRKMARLFH